MVPNLSGKSIGDSATWKYKLEKTNYDFTAKINGTTVTTVRSGEFNYTFGRTFTAEDLDSFKVVIEIIERKSNEVKVKYSPDSTERPETSIDNFGTVKVIIGSGEGAVADSHKVYEQQSLTFDISGLSLGYKYSGKIKHGVEEKEIALDGTKLKITDSFSAEESGLYEILVVRETVTGTLDLKDSKAPNKNVIYNMKNSYNGTQLSVTTTDNKVLDLQVGQVVTFDAGSVESEDITGYYYLDKDGVKQSIDGNSINITPELLSKVGGLSITFGLDVSLKYKLTLSKATGSEDYTYTAKYSNGSTYYLGTYVAKGTSITLTVDSLITGKYTVYIDGTSAGDSYSDTVVLNSDVNKEINIVKKSFTFTVNGYIRNTVESLYGDPISEGKITDKTIMYQSNSTLQFDRATTSKVLTGIKLSGNDASEVNIKVDGTSFVATKTEGDGSVVTLTTNDLKSMGYIISIGEKVEITITCYNDATMDLIYTALVDVEQITGVNKIN